MGRHFSSEEVVLEERIWILRQLRNIVGEIWLKIRSISWRSNDFVIVALSGKRMLTERSTGWLDRVHSKRIGGAFRKTWVGLAAALVALKVIRLEILADCLSLKPLSEVNGCRACNQVLHFFLDKQLFYFTPQNYSFHFIIISFISISLFGNSAHPTYHLSISLHTNIHLRSITSLPRVVSQTTILPDIRRLLTSYSSPFSL